MKSLNPTSLLCKGEELCLQQLFVTIPSDRWIEEYRLIPSTNKVAHKVTFSGWTDFDIKILEFSVPQNQSFSLLTYPFNEKWASSEKTILFSSISPDTNISVMVLQNFTRASIDFVVNNWWVVILYGCNFKKFFIILCSEDCEIFSTWVAFLMVKFGFSEKYFSTSSTVSTDTTVYEGPGAPYLRSWRAPHCIKLSIIL